MYLVKGRHLSPKTQKNDNDNAIHCVHNKPTTRQIRTNRTSVEHIKSQGDPMIQPFLPFASRITHTPPDLDGQHVLTIGLTWCVS